MVQSPSWEANWFTASQEIPRISRNPKVHYRTHKRPPPVSILGQPNPVHIPTSHLLEIHPNIHPSTPRSPQWPPSLRFPHQDLIHPLSSPIRATCPAHLILLYFITRTILGEECIKNVYTIDYFESEISDQSLTLRSFRGKTLLLVEGLISSVLESLERHAVSRPALCSVLWRQNVALCKISGIDAGGGVECGAAESKNRQIAQINKCPKWNKLHFLCEKQILNSLANWQGIL